MVITVFEPSYILLPGGESIGSFTVSFIILPSSFVALPGSGGFLPNSMSVAIFELANVLATAGPDPTPCAMGEAILQLSLVALT